MQNDQSNENQIPRWQLLDSPYILSVNYYKWLDISLVSKLLKHLKLFSFKFIATKYQKAKTQRIRKF